MRISQPCGSCVEPAGGWGDEGDAGVGLTDGAARDATDATELREVADCDAGGAAAAD